VSKISEQPFLLGDYINKTTHDDPDLTIGVEVSADVVSVGFLNQFEENSEREYIVSRELPGKCEEKGIKRYLYEVGELESVTLS
jgi:hypothetical protein